MPSTEIQKQLRMPLLLSKEEADKAGSLAVFSEIVIDASASVVREKFLDFEQWPKWTNIMHIEVAQGNLNDLESKPPCKLNLKLNLDNKEEPKKIAVPTVGVNNENAFAWGASMPLLFKVDHVFLFETVADDETKTRFVHYEYAGGMIGVVMKGMMKKMPQAYDKFNADFKKFVEE